MILSAHHGSSPRQPKHKMSSYDAFDEQHAIDDWLDEFDCNKVRYQHTNIDP